MKHKNNLLENVKTVKIYHTDEPVKMLNIKMLFELETF